MPRRRTHRLRLSAYLLSRCQVYVLKSLEKADLQKILDRAVTKDTELQKKHIELKETDAMMRYKGGMHVNC